VRTPARAGGTPSDRVVAAWHPSVEEIRRADRRVVTAPPPVSQASSQAISSLRRFDPLPAGFAGPTAVTAKLRGAMR